MEGGAAVVFEAAPTELVPTESRVVEGEEEFEGASEGLASMFFSQQDATNKLRAQLPLCHVAPFAGAIASAEEE